MIKEITNFFKENYKLIIATFLIGLLVHSFALTNNLFTYDEMNHLFSKGVSFESGRWGLELVSFIFPDVSMPWFNGVFALTILSISFCLIVNILEIKNKYFKLLICSTLITFPAISNTFVFMYAVTAYSISIFLSIISVILLRSNKKIYNFLSIITMILSLSIYQSYICITMIMLIILLMKDCINENKSIKNIMLDIVKYSIFIVISLGLYLIITKTINSVLNITYSHYKGLDSMGKFTIKDIINGTLISYKYIYDLFPEASLGDTFGFNTCTKVFIFISLLFTICLTFVKSIHLIKKKETSKAILLLVLLIVQPIAVNFIVVINPKIGQLYSVMIYQYVFLIIESIVLFECFNNKSNKLKKVIYGVFIILIFQFVTIANESYFHSYLVYENIYSFTSGLVNRIFKTDGYDKNVPVVFIGRYDGKLNTNYYYYFKEVAYMGSSAGNDDTIYPDMRYQFIKWFMGINFKYIEEEEQTTINNIKELPEFKQMNVYPYNNSIKKINGIIVVKFSE